MSEQFDHIEKYLLGLMSDQEKAVFEAQVAHNNELRQAVEKMNVIHNALEVSIEDNLRNKLKQLEKKQDLKVASSQKPAAKSRRLIQFAAAASVLLAISIGLWFFAGYEQNSITRFSEAEYIAYDYAQLRGEPDDARTYPFEMTSGNFDLPAAESWFTGWVENHPDDYAARFVLSDILYRQDKYSEASDQLEEIISSKSILWKEKAEWNYILLRQGSLQNTLSESLLEKIISDPTHSYHQRAKDFSELRNK